MNPGTASSFCATNPVLPVRYRDGYLRRACHKYPSNPSRHICTVVPGSGVVCTQRTTLGKGPESVLSAGGTGTRANPSIVSVSYQVQGPTKYIYMAVTGRLGSSHPIPPGAFLRVEGESCTPLASLWSSKLECCLQAVALSASCTITERGD